MTRKRTFFAVALLVTLLLAGVVSAFASSAPDGLEKVARDKGFSGTAQEHGFTGSPVAGYGVAGVDDARVSGGLAGVIGVGATLAVGGGVFLVLRRRGGIAAGPDRGASGRSSGGSSDRPSDSTSDRSSR